MSTRMPTLYLSHGAPPLADDPLWTRQLADWSSGLPRPTAILVVSAHWENAPLAVGATTTVPLYYDFGGFAQHYYEVKYPAPGAPELAAKVRALLRGPQTPVADVPDRGLDHGAYVPLVEMFPEADVPVLQISMPTLDPQRLLEIGRRLAPLRDEGVLIIGSGFFTHNLRAAMPYLHLGFDAPVQGWSAEFDDWGGRRWTPVTSTGCSTSCTRPRRALWRTRAPSTSHRCSSPSGRRGRPGLAAHRDRRLLDGPGQTFRATRLTRPGCDAVGLHPAT
ncbi:dioxygenase [Catellatospora coxensis]